MLAGSYHNGFAPRDGVPMYPELWRGCVGAWAPCLGPTGLVLRDWGPFRNHGSLTSMDAAGDWVLSQGRYALDFDGFNDFVDVGETGIPVDGALTISAWVRLAGVYTTRYAIAVRSNSAYLINWALVYGHGGSRQFGFWNSAGIGPEVSTAVVQDTNWHHVAATRSGVAGAWTITVYLDGVGTTASTATNPQSSTPQDTALGRWGATNGEYLSGQLADVAIYNRALRANEVSILASRRGIAYDLAPRTRGGVFTAGGFKAYWAARKAAILGGGLQ